MGTFSKALGGSGAYLACSNEIANFLLQRSAGFVYSTAPPPPVLAAALTAWRLLPTYEEQRWILAERAARARAAIRELGYNLGAGTTHIISIRFTDADTTARARDHLARADVAVSFIRAPTVPPNASRLRVALSVSHDDEDIASLLAALSSFPG
jgi:8-amino-7-oxononanoate synthase